MEFHKIGFIGLGLIGGSIARAIRWYYPDCTIIAFDLHKETLALATQESVIDVACTTVDSNFHGCDYIFLCTPVSFNNMYLKQLLPFLHDSLIITDVGSVKAPIHEEIHRLGLEPYFIGGHPMAGSEKSGFQNSKAHLIENAYYILTPSDKVSAEQTARFQTFIQSLHALPLTLDYQEHDYVTGAISHLPHIIAASLVNYVRDADSANELMKQLAAGGFKDITRIASSSPTMWQQICLQNKKNLSLILRDYIQSLEAVQAKIADACAQDLYDLFEHSRNYRNSMPDSSAGPIKKSFCLYCDILDESGAIATIATILAVNGISIKNIGIIHNREFEEGALRIEFYENEACEKAAALLQKHRYTIYKH